MSAQTAADLRAAADLLESQGWTQGEFHERTGDKGICHCTEGAIALVTGDHVNVRIEDDGLIDWDVEGVNSEAECRREAAQDALVKALGLPRYASIPQWNDADGRTVDEVIAALRAAADKAGQS